MKPGKSPKITYLGPQKVMRIKGWFTPSLSIELITIADERHSKYLRRH